MGDDDNAARRPSGSRAAGWMIYGTCPGARGRPGGRDQPRGIRLGRHGQGPFTRYGKE